MNAYDPVLEEITRVVGPRREAAWADPPESRQGQHDRRTREGSGSWVIVLSLLRAAAPGKWLRVSAFPTSSSFGPLIQQAKKGGLDAVSRTREDGRFDVYLKAPDA